MSEELSVGIKAPDFTIPTSENRAVSLKDYEGSRLLLFFYPKDSTPGCTTEARDFTQNLSEFTQLNTSILGISKDSLKKHANFILKSDLKIELASDETGNVCESYNVWKEKQNYGRSYMGIERTTILIDEKGVILHIWRKVKVSGHVDSILKKIAEL